MSHVAEDGGILHDVHVRPTDDVFVASSSDDNVHLLNDVLHSDHSKAVHAERIEQKVNKRSCIWFEQFYQA